VLEAPGAFGAVNGGPANKLTKVRVDGSIDVRDWNADQHDIGHIDQAPH
jgi:hypothetical protein